MASNRSPAVMADLLRNLQVNVTSADYTHCLRDWRELDYVPDHNKLYLICGGEGWLRIGGAEYYPAAGQLYLLPAHVRQSYSTISDDTFRKYWCHFTAKMGDIDLFQWLDAPPYIEPADFGKLQALFADLAALHADASPIARIREQSVMLDILSRFVAASPLRVASGRSDDAMRLEKIERYIDERLAEPITLEQIARHVHLHPNYLVRYFKKYMGVSPLRHIHRKRMDRARRLLGSTARPIREIAEQVGFPDTNHFAKAFRKETSFSPTEYRRQMASSADRS